MLNEKDLISVAKQYFDAWNNQNINHLSFLFDKDVVLQDWDITATGKEDVVKANQNIFNSVNNISAEVQDIGYNDNKVYAELLIKVLALDAVDPSDEDTIKVLDVITINDNSNITKISAYKQ